MSRDQRPELSIQSPASRHQGAASRAQRPTFASRVQEFPYANFYESIKVFLT